MPQLARARSSEPRSEAGSGARHALCTLEEPRGRRHDPRTHRFNLHCLDLGTRTGASRGASAKGHAAVGKGPRPGIKETRWSRRAACPLHANRVQAWCHRAGVGTALDRGIGSPLPMTPSNKALELTKPGSHAGGRTLPFVGSRAIIIKSCFAAQRQRSPDSQE